MITTIETTDALQRVEALGAAAFTAFVTPKQRSMASAGEPTACDLAYVASGIGKEHEEIDAPSARSAGGHHGGGRGGQGAGGSRAL